MNDVVTTVTNHSLFGRAKNSFFSALFGIVLFGVSFPVLVMNEGCSAKTLALIGAGRKDVIEVSADKVDPNNNARLVHISAEATTDEVLKDDDFGIETVAIRLSRDTQIYQWTEETETKEEKKLGGGSKEVTYYRYEKEWVDEPIDSSRFQEPNGHSNEGSVMPIGDKSIEAKNVAAGAFQLSPSLVSQIKKSEKFNVKDVVFDSLDETLREKAKVNQGGIYIGDAPNSPQIGDLSITFSAVYPQQVSLLSEQQGESFRPYKPKGVEGTIDRLEEGNFSAEVMFDHWNSENTARVWAGRFAGFMMMTFGIAMVFSPLTVLADVIPILGSMMRSGVFIFAGLVSFALSLVTIAIAWLAYRPVFAIGLLAVGVGIVVLVWYLGNMRQLSTGSETFEIETD